LFQLLIAEQLAAMDEEGGYGDREDENGDIDEVDNDRRRGNIISSKRNEQGVEYRLLYQKAVEDFICGDEVAFRTLLKECVHLRLAWIVRNCTDLKFLDSTIIR